MKDSENIPSSSGTGSMVEGLTEDEEFRLLDLYTAPPDKPPKRHSTMAGYIVEELWDLWEAGLISRTASGALRVNEYGRVYLGVD